MRSVPLTCRVSLKPYKPKRRVCVCVLPRQVGVDPNGKDQTSQPCADVVIGHTGSACCKKAIIKKGNPGMETPLMLAARGASEGAMRVRA